MQNEKKLTENDKINSIAFYMWVQSLDKTGYPKNENGTMMNIWQLYNHWASKVSRKPFLIHALGIEIKVTS